MVLLQGPRGSGKSTLVRREFPGHTYVSLDDRTDRLRARSDPEAFTARLRGPAIIDDLHRAPELVGYFQAEERPGRHILVSSRRLALPCPVLELFAPTRAERMRRAPVALETLGRFAPAKEMAAIPADGWVAGLDFLHRDVPDLLKVHDPDRFEEFVERARTRSGTILDQQGLADECGVAHRTAVRWLQVLDACFLTLLVRPLDVRFGRRVVQRPKLHFVEGGGFESEVVSEMYRNARHSGSDANFRFWRDSNGLEIPLIVQREEGDLLPAVIAESPTPADVDRLRRWMKLAGAERGALIGRSQLAARAGGIVGYGVDQL